uniref:Dioxygenase n=1 Tax=Lotharella globosa TaxID=91324 RepID=A0A7S3YV85_9EUKA
MGFCGCLRFTLYLAGALGLLAGIGASVVNSMWMNHAFDSFLDRSQGAEAYNEKNHFLLGNFAPVGDELSGLQLAVVQGKIPEGLDGIFIRNGPNPIPEHGNKKRYHWFDGHGYLHVVKFDSKSQTASYSSGWLQTPRYNYERALGHAYFIGVGEYIGLAGLLKAVFIAPKKMEFAGLTRITSGQVFIHFHTTGHHVLFLSFGC